MRSRLVKTLGPLLLLCGALVALPGPREAAAEPGDFWEFADPNAGAYTRHMQLANLSALNSVSPDLPLSERLRMAKSAIASYEKAIEVNPTAGEPHFQIAEMLSRHYLKADLPRRDPLVRAIEHWRAFERKAPDDPRMLAVFNERSISLTKLFGIDRNNSDLEAAVTDYDKELALIDQSSNELADSIATLLSNRAEVLMMLGRLDQAIAGYEQSLSFSDDALAGYGLAVALDRDGQRTRARDVAAVYAQSDRENKIVRAGTFFVPFGEKYYYLGLRHEGLHEYPEAVAAYREYLRILPRSEWAPIARKNLQEVLTKAGKRSPRIQSLPTRFPEMP